MDNRCCNGKTEIPKIYTVSRVVDEAHHHKTIFLQGEIMCKPGQFIMVWLPGVEEKPMAVSYHSPTEFGFTYHTLGTFTQGCNNLVAGDKVGIRGPYGNHFSSEEPCVVVGGGVGLSSLSTLIDALTDPIIIHGARSHDLLLYRQRYPSMIICTDDGSAGTKGFVTLELDRVLSQRKDIKKVYMCGPELMMKAVLAVCVKHGVDCEGSLERFMKCGYGICGNCVIDDQVICVDGPIYNSAHLTKMKEFGVSARLKTGRKVPLKEYYGWKG